MEFERPTVREGLAADLGGEPTEYDADAYLDDMSIFQKIIRLFVSDRPSEPGFESSREYTIEQATLRRRLSYDAVRDEEASPPSVLDAILPWKDAEATAALTRYSVQLEYQLDGEWQSVVAYEHHPAERPSLDATSGVALWAYRDGEHQPTEVVSPELPASIALDFAQSHLNEHLATFVRRFERWHGVE